MVEEKKDDLHEISRFYCNEKNILFDCSNSTKMMMLKLKKEKPIRELNYVNTRNAQDGVSE